MAKRKQQPVADSSSGQKDGERHMLWVTNNHHSIVVVVYNGTPLDPRPADLVLRPRETKAVEADVWGKSPSLWKLVQMGLVAVKEQDGAPPSYPPLSSITDALGDPQDRGVARDIVFGPWGMAASIIDLTPYTDDSRKVVDREFLTLRHLPILRAALKALEELGEGNGERAERLRARIRELEGLEQKLS
ncbi:MAG: hypothetical protein ACUVS5_11550 [Anaerolineae bacterium]